MLVMTVVNCRPTMPPPKSFGCSETSWAARSMPTESGGYDAIDLGDVEHLRVDAGHGGGVGLIVVEDELHRPPEQPALLVHVVFPDLHGEERGLAVGGEPTRQRHAEADLDRVRRASRERPRAREQQRHR